MLFYAKLLFKSHFPFSIFNMNSCESLQGTIFKVQIRAGNRNKTFLRITLNDSSQLMCFSTPIPRDKSNCTANLGLRFIGQPSPRVREGEELIAMT